MIDLQRIFDGFYNDKDITSDRLYTYAMDNVNRMTLNNPGGIYDTNIADTTSKATTLHNKITGRATDTATRKGGTTAKDRKRSDIEHYLAIQMPGAITAFGGKDKEGFISTYPNLMNSFYNVTKADFTTNVEALIVKANTYVATLGVPFKNTITTMFADYTTANDSQALETSQVTSDIDYEKIAVQELADQLTDNVGDVAHYNRRSTTALALYFNETLLFPAHTKEIKKGTPKPDSETEVCKITYSAGKRVHIHNKGASKLIFGMKLLGAKVGATVTLLPDEKSNEAFSFYFSNGDSLYVINPDSIDGIYQLDIIS